MTSPELPTRKPSTVDVRRRGQALVLTVVGEVDLADEAVLRDAIDGVVRQRPTVFVIDLSEVTFLSSAGLSALLEAHIAAAGHTDLRVVSSSPRTTRPLQLAGIDQVLAMYDSLDEALAP